MGYTLSLHKLTPETLDLIIAIQKDIYSGVANCDGSINFIDSLNDDTINYYIVYGDSIPVGMAGMYYYKDDPDNAWLGWFGIMSRYRRQQVGTEALHVYESLCRTKKFKYSRVLLDNYIESRDKYVLEFFISNGYIFEEYHNDYDPASFIVPTLILSKSLDEDEDVPLWDNKYINLTEQIEKQRDKDGDF